MKTSKYLEFLKLPYIKLLWGKEGIKTTVAVCVQKSTKITIFQN